jgi:hypothetical protein
MKGKPDMLMNFNFFSIPMVEMLQKVIQSLCIFVSLKIDIIEPTNVVQRFFWKEMPSMPIKHHLSYLSLH